MSDKLTDVPLVWGTPGDVEQTSDGGGDYSSTFRLTPRGAAKIAKALGATSFLWAEQCGHDYPEVGDAIHVAGEPSDMICLASPIFPGEASDGQSLEIRSGQSNWTAEDGLVGIDYGARTEALIEHFRLAVGGTRSEVASSVQVHEVDGEFVVADGAGWLPGVFATREAALRAAGGDVEEPRPQAEPTAAQALQDFLGKLAGDSAYALNFSSAAALHGHIVSLLKRDIAALGAR